MSEEKVIIGQQSQHQPQQQNQQPPKSGETKPVATATDKLLEAILRREQTAIQEHEAKQEHIRQRVEHYAKNAGNKHAAMMKTQFRCKHKKGGALQRAGNVDYAVSLHTYIDKTRVIKCHLCGMKWRKDDTAAFLLRGGKQVKNHTGIGWLEAWQMLVNSSNKPSASEIPMEVAQNITPGETETGELVTYEM